MQFFRNLENWGRDHASGALRRVMPTQEMSASQAGEIIRQNPSARILLIGLYQHMGQFLCATPLIRALKVSWPRASLQFLGNPVNAVAARANPHLDRVWVWRKSAFWEWLGQISAMRKKHFDLALLLTTERPSATGALIARATGARWVAGYAPSGPETWTQDVTALYHIRIPSTGEKNEVKKFLGLAQAFLVPPQGLEPEFKTSPEEDAAAEAFLSAQEFPTKGPLVGLFIGGKAERTDRLWPLTHFAVLANELREVGFRVIVLSPPPYIRRDSPPEGGPSPAGASPHTFQSEEHLRLKEFRRLLQWECPVFQEASLGRVAAFLKRLDLLVCPDGGILHLAASVGTSTLGLFFSTDPEVWRHALPQTFLDGRGRPSAAMSPETVASEVVRFLKVTTRA